MILVTGCAGFIGYHLSGKLLSEGEKIIGIDSINEYYDPALKEERIKRLSQSKEFTFYRMDLCDYKGLREVFSNHKVTKICHLAAQAGVRYSLDHPFAYQKANNEAFLNILECGRHFAVENFVFASSSSVYGNNTKLPFSEDDRTDTPISLYAATKKANEVTAHAYSELYKMNCSGMRFFTVYGPWGRPDMALFLFTKAILDGTPIQVFNNGKMLRNFTYIDDIVNGIELILNNPRPYEIYNIANNETVELLSFIEQIESALGKKAIKNLLPMQMGDVPATEADITKLQALGYKPVTNISEGIDTFISWYKTHYHNRG